MSRADPNVGRLFAAGQFKQAAVVLLDLLGDDDLHLLAPSARVGMGSIMRKPHRYASNVERGVWALAASPWLGSGSVGARLGPALLLAWAGLRMHAVRMRFACVLHGCSREGAGMAPTPKWGACPPAEAKKRGGYGTARVSLDRGVGGLALSYTGGMGK